MSDENKKVAQLMSLPLLSETCPLEKKSTIASRGKPYEQGPLSAEMPGRVCCLEDLTLDKERVYARRFNEITKHMQELRYRSPKPT